MGYSSHPDGFSSPAKKMVAWRESELRVVWKYTRHKPAIKQVKNRHMSVTARNIESGDPRISCPLAQEKTTLFLCKYL
jgi:hypothetical protein